LRAPPSERQWELIHRLEARLAAVCRPGSLRRDSMDAAASLHEIINKLDLGHYSASTDVGGPETLTASNMSLPKCAAIIPLQEPVLPAAYASLLRAPSAFLVPEALRPSAMPPMCMSVSNWLDVAVKLWDVNLVGLCPDRQLLEHNGRTVRAGLFGVAKKNTLLRRMIVDRRPMNSLEYDLVTALRLHRARDPSILPTAEDVAYAERLAILPHASQFCDIFMTAGSRLTINLADASDFYYLFEWGRERALDTIVGWPIYPLSLLGAGATRDVDGLRALPPVPHSLYLRSPAMGDQKAAGLTQVAHQHILRDNGGLGDAQWLSFGWAPPRGNIFQGVYIDDGAVVGVYEPDDADRVRGDVRAERARSMDAYQRAGIIMKAEKEVVDAAEATVWGGQLSTARQDVGANVEKLGALMIVTLRLIRRAHCTPLLLQKVLGAWVHVLTFYRPGFCLLDRAFGWCRLPGAGMRRERPLTHAVIDELLGVTLLGPLLRCDLAALVAPRVYASDATLTDGAVVQAPLSCEEAVWLWSRAPRRGSVIHYRNLPEGPTFECSESPRYDPLLHKWVEGKQFYPVVSYM